jgi:hypothetical protein
MISIREQIDEVKRELAQRERVYARLVANGKLRQSLADYQMQRMQAVLGTLERVQSLPLMFMDRRTDQMQ